MYNLQLGAVRGSLNILRTQEVRDICLSLGCTESDWDLVTSNKPWLAKDRARVLRVLHGSLYGMLDTLGLPRFSVPAEYVAAVIYSLVEGLNIYTACAWLGTSATASELQQDEFDGVDRVTPRQLYAFIIEISGNSEFKRLSETMNAKIDKKAQQNEKK